MRYMIIDPKSPYCNMIGEESTPPPLAVGRSNQYYLFIPRMRTYVWCEPHQIRRVGP